MRDLGVDRPPTVPGGQAVRSQASRCDNQPSAASGSASVSGAAYSFYFPFGRHTRSSPWAPHASRNISGSTLERETCQLLGVSLLIFVTGALTTDVAFKNWPGKRALTSCPPTLWRRTHATSEPMQHAPEVVMQGTGNTRVGGGGRDNGSATVAFHQRLHMHLSMRLAEHHQITFPAAKFSALGGALSSVGQPFFALTGMTFRADRSEERVLIFETCRPAR